MKNCKVLVWCLAGLYGGAAALYIILYIRGFAGFPAAQRIFMGLLFVFFTIAAVFAALMWKKIAAIHIKAETPAGEKEDTAHLARTQQEDRKQSVPEEQSNGKNNPAKS